MTALKGLALLLLLQTAGELFSRSLAIPIPGPVIGMVLLLVVLRWEAARLPVQTAADFLLSHLSLLFVPVGVGVITHLDLVARYGSRLMFIIVLSTWIGLAVTALVMRRWLPATAPGNEAHG